MRTPTDDLKTFTAAEIQGAALKVIREYTSRHSHVTWPDNFHVVAKVAEVLCPEWYESTRGSWPGNPFGNKVVRQLKNMVDEGVLVKRNFGYRNAPRYATPEQAAEWDGIAAATAFAKADRDDEFKRLVMRAATAGFEIGRYGDSVTVSLEDMKRILDFIEDCLP